MFNGVDLALKNQIQKLKYHSDINFMSFNILDLEQGYVRYGHKGGILAPIVDSISRSLGSSPSKDPKKAGEYLHLIGAHGD